MQDRRFRETRPRDARARSACSLLRALAFCVQALRAPALCTPALCAPALALILAPPPARAQFVEPVPLPEDGRQWAQDALPDAAPAGRWVRLENPRTVSVRVRVETDLVVQSVQLAFRGEEHFAFLWPHLPSSALHRVTPASVRAWAVRWDAERPSVEFRRDDTRRRVQGVARPPAPGDYWRLWSPAPGAPQAVVLDMDGRVLNNTGGWATYVFGVEFEASVGTPVFDEQAALEADWPDAFGRDWPAEVLASASNRFGVEDFVNLAGIVRPTDDTTVAQFTERILRDAGMFPPESRPPVRVARLLTQWALRAAPDLGEDFPGYSALRSMPWESALAVHGILLRPPGVALQQAGATRFSRVHLLCAVLRSAGLPARVIVGWDAKREELTAWVEFALAAPPAEGDGPDAPLRVDWVPIEPREFEATNGRHGFGTVTTLADVVPLSNGLMPPTTQRMTLPESGVGGSLRVLRTTEGLISPSADKPIATTDEVHPGALFAVSQRLQGHAAIACRSKVRIDAAFRTTANPAAPPPAAAPAAPPAPLPGARSTTP